MVFSTLSLRVPPLEAGRARLRDELLEAAARLLLAEHRRLLVAPPRVEGARGAQRRLLRRVRVAAAALPKPLDLLRRATGARARLLGPYVGGLKLLLGPNPMNGLKKKDSQQKKKTN